MFLAMTVLAGIVHLVCMAHALLAPLSGDYTGITFTSSSGEASDLRSEGVHLWYQLDSLIVLMLSLLVVYIVISRLRYMGELNRRHRNAFESQLREAASGPKEAIKNQDRDVIIRKQGSSKISHPNTSEIRYKTSARERVSA